MSSIDNLHSFSNRCAIHECIRNHSLVQQDDTLRRVVDFAADYFANRQDMGQVGIKTGANIALIKAGFGTVSKKDFNELHLKMVKVIVDCAGKNRNTHY